MKFAWWKWSALFFAVVLVNAAGSTTVLAQEPSSPEEQVDPGAAQKQENQNAAKPASNSKHNAKAAHFGNNKTGQATASEPSKQQKPAAKQGASHSKGNHATLTPATKREVSKGKKQSSKTASKDSKKKPNAAKKGDAKAKN
jgi:hypothetical protein